METIEVVESSLLSSFLTGLFITLEYQKATFFYLGFFPAFLNLSRISFSDTVAIVAVTIVAVGDVKLEYAFMADEVRGVISPKVNKTMNIAAGCVMIAVGAFLITKT